MKTWPTRRPAVPIANLSARQQALTAASLDPVRAFRRKLQRAFQSAGVAVPPFAFVLEVSPSGRTHLHGVVIAGAMARKSLVEALARAGGKISTRAGSRQVALRQLYDATGCRNYMLLDAEHTRRALGVDRLTYISGDLRRLTRAVWKG